MEKMLLLMRCVMLVGLVAVGVGMPVQAQAENLRLVTGELPPYATQERSDDGIALDIVRKAFGHAGMTVSYTFKPWTRSLEEARAGQWDGSTTGGAYLGRHGHASTGAHGDCARQRYGRS